IVTCNKKLENNAIRELESLFFLLGDKNARFIKSKVLGVILGKISIDPRIAIREIRDLLNKKSWMPLFTKRYIPIDVTVKSDINEIKNAVMKLAEMIPIDKTFRITVEKRFTQISAKSLINSIASNINRKVSLKNPDYIILIEIIGSVTGLALIKPDDILSVEKEILTKKRA
ncbi:MAG: THUMP domain-containing protein, partial [Candidatus Geothermarchaeota archaeon]